jgi:hypothetical protein
MFRKKIKEGSKTGENMEQNPPKAKCAFNLLMKNVNKLKLQSTLTPSSSNSSLNDSIVFLDEVLPLPNPQEQQATSVNETGVSMRHSDQIFTPTHHVKQCTHGKRKCRRL